MNQVKVFSPGKVIISGEHSVVYGQPALLASLKLGITISLSQLPILGQGRLLGEIRDKDPYTNFICQVAERHFRTDFPHDWSIGIDSNLPIKAGLGSSAAYAHALIKAASQLLEINLSQEDLFKLVWQAEKFVHGNSSGADPAAVVFGNLIRFQVIDGQPRVESIRIIGKAFQLMLIDSGAAQESTKQMIELVARQNKPKVIKRLGFITQQLIDEVAIGKLNPNTIKLNQRLLDRLCIVSDRAHNIIDQIKKAGGAAKITGAGGVLTGSGWLLAWHSNLMVLEEFAHHHQLQRLFITIGGNYES